MLSQILSEEKEEPFDLTNALITTLSGSGSGLSIAVLTKGAASPLSGQVSKKGVVCRQIVVLVEPAREVGGFRQGRLCPVEGRKTG